MNRTLLTLVLAVGLWLNALSINVFMTGDSHVNSKIYPDIVGDILFEADPGIEFSFWGKNGARFDTFNSTPAMMETIYKAKPDILIVHLGTNDSYSKNFDKPRMMRNITTFYDNIHQKFPDCCLVLVTPFYNRLKDKSVNDNAGECAEVMLEFAQDHDKVFVVDNNGEHGMYFLEGGGDLIRSDGVHLTVKGYERLAEQVAAAVIELEDIWFLEEE